MDENAFEYIDSNVEYGRRYGYRVQAVCRDNTTSAFEYQWARVDRIKSVSGILCRSSTALLDSVGTLNPNGMCTLGLIVVCFLTVYGLMRTSVMGVQGTQSRRSRLKRIKKSSEEVTSVARTSMVPRQSSISVFSTSPPVSIDPGQRSSMFDVYPSSITATAGGLTRGHSIIDSMMPRESASKCCPSTSRPMSRSICASNDIATGCEHCGKNFGLFRKRYVCDICHSVSLCRKCGHQASVDNFANAQAGTPTNVIGNTRASIAGRGMGGRRSSLSQNHQKKLKIRTICKYCCDDVYRYSTHASVRPSYGSAEMQARRV